MLKLSFVWHINGEAENASNSRWESEQTLVPFFISRDDFVQLAVIDDADFHILVSDSLTVFDWFATCGPSKNILRELFYLFERVEKLRRLKSGGDRRGLARRISGIGRCDGNSLTE